MRRTSSRKRGSGLQRGTTARQKGRAKMHMTAKSWLEVTSALIAVVALGVSVRSCQLAEHATAQAERALLVGERAYLSATLERPKNSTNFFSFDRKPGFLVASIFFRIENLGNTPASDVVVLSAQCPPGQACGDPVTVPGPISLAPGASEKVRVDFSLTANDLDLLRSQFESEEAFIEVMVEWHYRTVVDESTHRTRVRYLVKNSSAALLERAIE
jgi:hypothetical protein